MAENNDATILQLLKKELKIYSDKQLKTVLDLLAEGTQSLLLRVIEKK